MSDEVLNLVDVLHYDGAVDSQLPVQPINVLPLQCKQFTHAQSETYGKGRHRLERLRKFRHQHVKFIDGKTTGLSRSLCGSLDPPQALLGCGRHLRLDEKVDPRSRMALSYR